MPLRRCPAAYRESDLLAFEIAIERSHPGSVMTGYNKVNGDYAGGNAPLINDVLNPGLGVRSLRARPGKRRPTRRDRVQGGAIRRTAQAA
jgi:hypothetical protein